MATLPRNATQKALTPDVVAGSDAAVAPVTRIDSPSAMITNSAQRSAMCAPSTFQSVVLDASSPGTEKYGYRPAQRIASAGIHAATCVSPPAQPPQIQNPPATACQQTMRWKVRCSTGWWPAIGDIR